MDEGQQQPGGAAGARGQPAAGPYRRPSPGFPPPPEAEAAAVAALTRRATRARTLTVVPSVVLGLAVGIAGYWGLRELQFQVVGVHVPWLTGVAGLGLPFGASLRVARRLSDGFVRWRRAAWIREAARVYGLPEETLEEYALLL